MIKVFISLPMRGRTDEEILKRRDEAFEFIKKSLPECELIDTFVNDTYGEKHPGLQCLGKSLQMLDEADGIWFLDGWKDARGCRIEHECAKAYGIPTYYLY